MLGSNSWLLPSTLRVQASIMLRLSRTVGLITVLPLLSYSALHIVVFGFSRIAINALKRLQPRASLLIRQRMESVGLVCTHALDGSGAL